MMREELLSALDQFPRTRLAAVPTPLEHLPRLSRALGGPEIYVKRDDLTGLAFGGNKVRQLEYFLGEALARDATVLIAGGGPAWSNHARLCSAAARAVGLKPIIVLQSGDSEQCTGNFLVTQLFCGDIRFVQELNDLPITRLEQVAARRNVFEQIAAECRDRGERPYVLAGSSTPLGALGYARTAVELSDQCAAMSVFPDYVSLASTGATQAGLELGSRLLSSRYKIIGISPRPTSEDACDGIARLATRAATMLGFRDEWESRGIVNDGSISASTFGATSQRSNEALRLAAETEGLLLDPVYTAVGMAGLIDWIRRGQIRIGETVVFIHTGGLPILFSHLPDLTNNK